MESYVQGQNFEAFAEDGRTVDAVLRNLGVVGEAAKCVPETLRVAIPIAFGVHGGRAGP